MDKVIGYALMILWGVCCYAIVVVAVERPQQDKLTTLLYIAFLFMFFFGGTGVYRMFAE